MSEKRLYRFNKGSTITLKSTEDVDIEASNYDEAYYLFSRWLEDHGDDDYHMGVDCEGIGFDINETDPS